jgi:hypothetical protein
VAFGISMTAKPQEVIAAMDASTYFTYMAKLMCTDAPPTAEDGPIVARMASIGIVPKPFDVTKLDTAVQTAVNDSVKTGWQQVERNQKGGVGRVENGWTITTDLGVYGTTVAAFGWPANLQEDASTRIR